MDIERRLLNERRKSPQPFNRHSLYGRRRNSRRQNDACDGVSGDNHGSPLFGIVVGIIILCSLDAHNTLVLIDAGGLELNPLMDVLIQRDVALFVYLKLVLTTLGLIALVAYHYRTVWRGFKVTHLIYVIFTGYLVLVAYQATLLPGALLVLLMS